MLRKYSEAMNNISVVMPCYINSDHLVDLTKATLASLGTVKELIIVDDASPIGGGYLRSVADIYIRNRDNLGYARSVNRGFKQASGDYIAVANNDIRLSPNWQEVVLSDLTDPKVYSLHFRMTDYDVPFQYGNKTTYTGKERWCHASFYVIHAKNTLMYYDEHYRNTYDDWDLFTSVRKAGYQTAYTDKACFQHVHSATIPYMPKHPEVNNANKEYYKSKWGEYAEDLFTKDFPDQMMIPYPKGFEL